MNASLLDAQVRREFTEVHMGMPVRIVLYAPNDATARAAASAAFRHVAELEDTFSDYRADSELRRLEPRAGSWVAVSMPLFEVLQRALHIARVTDGAFDPTAGPLVALWRAAHRAGTLPATADLAAARQRTGWRLLQLDTATQSVRLAYAGMRLDLGGIAKGYVLAAALRSLHDHGIDAALIEAGGDIVVGAAPPGRTGWSIDTPGAGHAFAVRAGSLSGAAIATSGATFQYLELEGTRHSHIIDPRSGLAVTRPLLVRVLASDAVLADALATALSVEPNAANRLLQLFPDAIVEITPVRTGAPPRGGAAR